MAQRVYSDPKRRKVLLETRLGFALFDVEEHVLKKNMMDIWVYFRDASAAKGHLSLLDFSKFSDKDSAWDGNTCRSKHLMELIKRICNNEKPLFVQCSRLKEVILQKLEIQCLCVDDDDVILELIWGINNVLECFIKSFIKEEIDNIERGCLPFSKGLEKCLEDYCISVPKEMLNKKLISQLGFVRYLEISSKEIANKLRESFDKHVCNIGESIEDDLNYTKVLARILVPEIATEFNFSQMFSGELALKVQEAEKSECVTEYRKNKFTYSDRCFITVSLSHLLAFPKFEDTILKSIKRTEAEDMMGVDA